MLLPTEALLQLKGGLLDNETETRQMMWCAHGNELDYDGYTSDIETAN